MRRPLLKWIGGTILVIVLLSLAYAGLFGPAGRSVELEEFLVEPDESLAEVAEALSARGFARNTFGVSIAYARMKGSIETQPGGYELSTSMDAWTVAKILSGPPKLAWVRVPEGYRKEQVENLLARTLGWTEEERQRWEAETAKEKEGVYFPDIYLIPSDQDPAEVAVRLRERFAHETAVLKVEAEEKGEDWEEVLVVASLIERESNGKDDRELISGIIENRLEDGMPLGIDATLQYIRGKEGEWWPTPQSEDKYLESPYNTYFRAGLPPAPIANPGLASIDAALHPKETACLYYLHDYDGTIHCATTYRAHVANVDRYLR